MKIIIALAMLFALPVSVAHSEDWQTWIEQRTTELEEQKAREHAANCERLDLQFNSAMSALRTNWRLFGPSAQSFASAQCGKGNCRTGNPGRLRTAVVHERMERASLS